MEHKFHHTQTAIEMTGSASVTWPEIGQREKRNFTVPSVV